MRSSTAINHEQARQAAQRIYKRINFSGGNLQLYELNSLMQETYDFLKIPFKPTTNDIKQYTKVLDANGDGGVSLQDLQNMAVQYLCGEGVLSGLNTSTYSGGLLGSQFSSQSYKNKFSSDYLNYSSSQNIERTLKPEPQSAFNYSNYLTGSQYMDQSYINKSGYSSTGIGNFQNQSSSSRSFIGIGSSNIFNNLGSTVAQTQEHIQTKQFNQAGSMIVEQPKSRYTQNAQNYLNITRDLFKKYANTTNTITRDKVSALLNETYGALGRKGYFPSEEDVSVWMKLCDTNSDGHVEESQYQYFVVRALQRSGVQVNA